MLEQLDRTLQDVNYRIATLEALSTASILAVANRDRELAIDILEKTFQGIPDTLPRAGVGVSPFYSALDELLVELRLRGEG